MLQRSRCDQGVRKSDTCVASDLACPLGDSPTDRDLFEAAEQSAGDGHWCSGPANSSARVTIEYANLGLSTWESLNAAKVVDEHVGVDQ